jgi:hypothetical protein
MSAKPGEGDVFTIRNGQIAQYVDKHPQQYSLADIASLFSVCDWSTIPLKPNCYQLGFSFGNSSMLTLTYGVCLVTFLLSKTGTFCRFDRVLPLFLSLFSVTLLTIQEGTFNEINDLRGGGLQVENGGAVATENR